MKAVKIFILAPLTLYLVGCNDDSENKTNPNNKVELSVPTTYSFNSSLIDGENSVSYTGQTKRHILISDLTATIKSLSEDATRNVRTDLDFFFRYDGSSSDAINYGFNLDDASIIPEPTYGDISSGKNLIGKIAGEDPGLINDEFFGWGEGLDDTPTPVELLDYYFSKIHAMATDGSTEQINVTGNASVDLDKVYISNNGHDYSQLVQKFLLGAVTFSQGTGDYLKTDFSADNTTADGEGTPYTTLQHKWDEAFGYFGAARNYNDFNDDEITANSGRAEFANGYNDSNGDGLIDIRSEINLGHSANCAKRDRGATDTTDFTKQAFDAFLTGRELLNGGKNLTSEELVTLQEAALTASVTWEKCIAATVVHYINSTLADMDKFTTDNAYLDLDAYKNHAKHWSEMKGFALGLQFNPDSPFRADSASLDQLKQVLTLMGDAPVLANGTQNGVAFAGGTAQYQNDLLTARNILRDTYQFTNNNSENW